MKHMFCLWGLTLPCEKKDPISGVESAYLSEKRYLSRKTGPCLSATRISPATS